MTSDLESFSALLRGLYDAAAEPGLWRPALARIGGALGGCAAIVLSSDRRTQQPVAARPLDIAERTGCSHLAAIFLKTGTTRQAELRVLASMAG